MFKKLKKKKMIAKFMNFSNITTVPQRGSRTLLKNERGIFRLSVVRSILMGLIYDMKYPDIDSKMSDCQMGGRKRKGCKNNIFILNGLIHDVLIHMAVKTANRLSERQVVKNCVLQVDKWGSILASVQEDKMY